MSDEGRLKLTWPTNRDEAVQQLVEAALSAVVSVITIWRSRAVKKTT